MYLYHAHAVALGGILERPSPLTMEAHAPCSLPISGGTSSANAGSFDNGLVSFDSAQSSITGNAAKRNGDEVYYTGISVVINRLSVGGVFKADQIVARMSCEHIPSKSDEPTIVTTGSHFDNLKIAGHSATVAMSHDLFTQFPRFGECCDAWSGKGKSKGKP